MAFVVITHQHPGHTSLLPELLGKETKMSVVEAADGMKLEANHVYVGPSGGHLALLGGTLQRMETDRKEAPRLPIDYFFRSLAEDQRERAIGIVLSGTGTDGTLGVKAIKGESGMVMVQQPESAKYAGMPSSAIATGMADYVLPTAAMPRQLVAYVKGPYLAGGAVAADGPEVAAEPIQKIFVLLRSRTGHDFSSYKTNTIGRRIERRMNVHQISRPSHYLRYLRENPHEIDSLFKELLIGVTSFFRDPDAWEKLCVELERLIASRPEDYTLRIWVPGCSSGEEVYSTAILFRECMDTAKRGADAQVFGTDLDTEAIETARAGKYPDGIAVDVSPKRLERFFTRDDGFYRVRNEIRELAVFAVQNVIKDPPFTKLDMIVCRNLLIYLNNELQKKLLPIFHYALKPDGLLFLGPSETLGASGELFEPLDKRWKIFRRRESATALRALPEMPTQPRRGLSAAGGEAFPDGRLPSVLKEGHVGKVIERVLLARFAPVSAVVSERGDIVYVHGRTGDLLEPTAGEPRHNIVEMAREGLQIELAAALRQCAASGADVTRQQVKVKANGHSTRVNLHVCRLKEPESVRGLLLVTFQPVPEAPAPVETKPHRPAEAVEVERLAQLERELQYMKETYQTTLEELETSNEELKSTNEELQSTNEELQSTNEELETSKEEMQSLNEELTTVNAELQSKVEQLSQATDDMQNLLNSTNIATVFLDNELSIKRFTDQARELVMLRPTDVGRPISELASHLEQDNLPAECSTVLRTLVYKEREVRTKQGSHYLMRIMPYRTAENVIDGLVLTFVDINRLKEAEKSLRRMAKVFQDAANAILIVDLAGTIVDLNDTAERQFGLARPALRGKSLDTIIAKEGQKQVHALLDRCRAGETMASVQCAFADQAGRTASVEILTLALADEHGEPDAVALVAKPMV